MIIDIYDHKELHCAIGVELFRVRQRRGLSLYHMSNNMRINKKVLDRIERGRHDRYETMQKILDYYHKKIKIELVD